MWFLTVVVPAGVSRRSRFPENSPSQRRTPRALRRLAPALSVLALLLAACGGGAEQAKPPPRCGDGVVDPGEQCDAGASNSDTRPGACRTTCVLPRCGDGVVDAGEQCDAGAANSDTTPGACRTTCVLPRCGDGVVDPGEQCDAGPAISDTTPGACRTTCVLPRCGDGIVDPGEQCDTGAANSDTQPGACRTSCRLPICGDGVVDPGEQCDDGRANSDSQPGACRTTCRLPVCGDGVLDPGEQCDDGALNSDAIPGACRTSCQASHCGDAVVDPGETCDDGVNDGTPGHCAPTCTCSAPPFVMAERLAAPESGDAAQLISLLSSGTDDLVFPPGIGYSANWGAVSQWLTLDHVDLPPSVRWGPLAWEQVDAHVVTAGGHTLVETWTIGWAHDLGARHWVSVGAVAPTIRRVLDRAVLLNTAVIPWTADAPAFPDDQLGAALDALQSNTISDIVPILSGPLRDAFALAMAETPLVANGRTPDVWLTSAVPVSTVTEGCLTYTTIRATWTSRIGLPHAENWILIWAYRPDEARWALEGLASTYPRQRLGELSRWWDLNRAAYYYDSAGFFGREALARVLALNETAEGLTMSSTDPTTESLAARFTEDALVRHSLPSLPADPRQITNVFAGHLAASYREGSWVYQETPFATLPRLLEERAGWCESNIVLSGMLRTAGVKARYVLDDTGITKTEVWTRVGWQVGTFDDGDRTSVQNQAWYWLGASMDALSHDSIHTNAHIVVFLCDPHGFCSMRRLYRDPSTARLFQTPNGLACFDWTTYPLTSVPFLWKR
jgi:hypothetical protein